MFLMGLVEDLLAVDRNCSRVYWAARAAFWVALVLISTHCFTTCRFVIQSLIDRRFQGKEPLTLPYSIPGVGNALQAIRNTHNFYEYVTTKSPDGSPVRIRLGSLHAYLVFGAHNVQTIFRNSKDLTFEEFALRVAQKVKRLPVDDAALLAADKSGSATRPLTDVTSTPRIWRKFHEIYEKNLTGSKAVSSLTDRFVDEFAWQIKTSSKSSWKDVKINDMLQDIMLAASTITLAGPALFELDPHFTKHFWEYDEAFMSLLYGLPRYLCRKGWDARDHCLESVKSYLKRAWDNIDGKEAHGHNPDWDPYFGSKLVRAREEALKGFGISLEGRASFELGLIWSINSNAIPMTSWIVIEILSRPGLIDRIREEVTRAVTTDAKTGSPIVNIPLLVTLPLLHSVYSECLRLRNSVQVVRQLRNDLEVDGYVLKAGNLVIAPSWLAHRDSSTWSSPGHDLNGDSHLANDFWAERFLHRGKTTMESGNYFPYGGGTAACPGRYYAKQEILAAVALLVAYCEFEPISFVDQSGQRSDSGPQVGSEARGVARIDRDLLVRMRRRSMGEGVRFLI